MMVVKPEQTDKEKALRAIQTLYNAAHAIPEFTILPNDIYQARKLLERHFENLSDLETAAPANDELRIAHRIFHTGEEVIVQGGQTGVITGFYILVSTSTSKHMSWHPSQVYQLAEKDIANKYLNPLGFFATEQGVLGWSSGKTVYLVGGYVKTDTYGTPKGKIESFDADKGIVTVGFDDLSATEISFIEMCELNPLGSSK